MIIVSFRQQQQIYVVGTLIAKFGSVYGNEVFLLVYQNVDGNGRILQFKLGDGGQCHVCFDTGHVQFGEEFVVCIMIILIRRCRVEKG